MDKAEHLDDSKSTDESDEPPTSDIDAPISPTASDNGIGSVDRKRKLSISPSNKTRAAHKLPRTAYRRAQSNSVEDAHQNNSDLLDSSGTLSNTGDTIAAFCAAFSGVADGLEPNCKATQGTSQSALASRKLRREVASGTHTVQKKRFENWKEKITDLDPCAQFDPSNHLRVRHSRCSKWLLVKEPGDATRFKQHVKACRAKPVPAGGTLMGMGWLKAKGVGTGGNGECCRESGKGEMRMPCRGVSDMDILDDDPLIDQYLKRTGVAGGGGRSVSIISMERFKKKFRNLTQIEKEEVRATQRAEWMWRNDHLKLRVFATTCKLFTLSRSLASSLCAKCEQLLILHSFTVAIHKPTPKDKNVKYTNNQYINPLLGLLYAKAKGLRAIIEHPVSDTSPFPQLPHSRQILRMQVLHPVSDLRRLP